MSALASDGCQPNPLSLTGARLRSDSSPPGHGSSWTWMVRGELPRLGQAHGKHGTGSHSQQTCRPRVGFQSLGRENEGRKRQLACGSTKVNVRGGIREVEEPGRIGGLRVRFTSSSSAGPVINQSRHALSRHRPIVCWLLDYLPCQAAGILGRMARGFARRLGSGAAAFGDGALRHGRDGA